MIALLPKDYDEMRQERDRLQARVTELEHEIEIADREETELLGHYRQLQARIARLVEAVKDHRDHACDVPHQELDAALAAAGAGKERGNG